MYMCFMCYALALFIFCVLEFVCRQFLYGVKTYIWYQSCFGFKGTPLLLRGFLVGPVVDPIPWEIYEIDFGRERRWRAMER